MALTLKLITAATALLFTTAVFAETNGDLPPSCPGGGTATGKITCTGPVLRPTCTEGPPWTCTIKDDNAATLEVGDGGTVRPPRRIIDVMPPMSLSDGGSASGASGGGGGGGGGKPGFGGLVNVPTVMLESSGSGPIL
jgi:hypothetical protein